MALTAVQAILREWDGEFVIVRHDHATGAGMTIAVHSTRPVGATGGTRARTYACADDALRDALGLAATMTLKFALLGLPRGGGKAVLDLPEELRPADRAGLLLRYGDLVESLGGVFQTGPDLGVTTGDLDRIAERTRHVFGTSPSRGGAGDPGPHTALGVLAGMRACLQHRFGSPELEGRTVLVQGLGGVGSPLAQRLGEAGADVLVTDVRPEVRERYAAGERFGWVEPDAALSTPCDVFAPCAAGGILRADTIPHLACAIVAGSANNQLATLQDAERLAERGILHAPDVLISGGGAVFLLGSEALGWSAERIERHILGLGDDLLEVFRMAGERGITPREATLDLARRRRAAAVDS